MNSKELSEKTQIPISTIRYYEKIGLIPQPVRKENNYRDYSDNYLPRLEFINYLSGLGFTLMEIKEFFADITDTKVTQSYILQKLQEREKAIQKQLNQLASLQNQIQEITKDYLLDDDLIEQISHWIQ